MAYYYLIVHYHQNVNKNTLDKHLHCLEIIFEKLKTFNRHHCFGENVNSVADAMRNIIIYGNIMFYSGVLLLLFMDLYHRGQWRQVLPL